MKRSYSIEFSCSPKKEQELLIAICDTVDKFREKNKYDGNNQVLVKVCDPLKDLK